MISVSINVNLDADIATFLEKVKSAVKAATEDSAQWIKEDIFDDQKYVGDTLYPDVSEKTKKYKAKRGMEKVGIMTGNLRASFNTEYAPDGLTGTICGGGSTPDGKSDYSKFLSHWQVAELWKREHSDKAREIIRSALGHV